MDDANIIICPVDKGKAVVAEDRKTCVMKTLHQIVDGDCELAKGSERTILTRLYGKLIAQLNYMPIKDFKEQRKSTITGPTMASRALLIKVHKNKFPGRAYVYQIDDPSYNI